MIQAKFIETCYNFEECYVTTAKPFLNYSLQHNSVSI